MKLFSAVASFATLALVLASATGATNVGVAPSSADVAASSPSGVSATLASEVTDGTAVLASELQQDGRDTVGTQPTTTSPTTTAPNNELGEQGSPTSATSGARPGFGCGDRNHTHSGPPGRPDATPPPGCANR